MDDKRFRIAIAPQGWQFEAGTAATLLHAAQQAGIVLPRSCQNGTCRTCMCMLLSGQVSYRIEWPGLTREEKADGCILPCVAYAESDLVIEAPAARRDGTRTS